MKSSPRTLLAAAAAASLLGAAAARGGERDDLLKAFAQLSRDARQQYRDVKPLAVKAPGGRSVDLPAPRGLPAKVRLVQTPVGPSRNMVKIWGELAKDGKKVSLAGYRWDQSEQFYLCFEAALPVRFAFHNLSADGTNPTQLLPTESKPSSFDAIPAGREFKLPIALETEGAGDERIVLTVVLVGSEQEPRPPVKDRELSTFGARQYREDMDAAFREARAQGQAYRGLEVEPPKVESTDRDDVALVAVSGHDRGTIELVLKKKR
jgi:hypothetical protein